MPSLKHRRERYHGAFRSCSLTTHVPTRELGRRRASQDTELRTGQNLFLVHHLSILPKNCLIWRASIFWKGMNAVLNRNTPPPDSQDRNEAHHLKKSSTAKSCHAPLCRYQPWRRRLSLGNQRLRPQMSWIRFFIFVESLRPSRLGHSSALGVLL